jgi:hypothetical protein
MKSKTTSSINFVGIRPESSILTVLSALNYTAWYAIAEFIDNSIQSYLAHKKEILAIEGKKFRLRIDIKFDRETKTIEICDNAAGIYLDDYSRAFRPAALPSNNKGLSEFGMGMKSAACWFTWTWSVRSKALGENVERQVWFDVKKIASEKIEELPIAVSPSKSEKHYTVIRLENLEAKFPATKTYTKIRNHLASIYRQYIRTGEIEIFFDKDEEPLKYEDPTILTAPIADSDSTEIIQWRKDISFSMTGGKTVTGYAAIRKDGSTSHAGFSLFRRNRLIVGSDDDTYRPSEIFGRSNDFRYQRIFGELNLSGFSVSHTKDGFKWEDSEQEFIEKLKEELKNPPLDILSQAHKYRSRLTKTVIQKPISKQVIEVEKALARPDSKKALSSKKSSIDDYKNTPKSSEKNKELDLTTNSFRLEIDNQTWECNLITNNDHMATDWISVKGIDGYDQTKCDHSLEITLYVNHPVISNFVGPNLENLGLMIRIAVTIGLAKEKTGKLGMNVGPFMYWLNRIMREVSI